MPAENAENAARREKRRRCPRKKKKIIRVVRVADVKNVLIGDETIVDTTGAGDAFVGAFCASLAAGHALTVCLQRASVAGTLGCAKVGARAGAPRGDEIARAPRTSPSPPTSATTSTTKQKPRGSRRPPRRGPGEATIKGKIAFYLVRNTFVFNF